MEDNKNGTVGKIFNIFEDFTYDGVTLNIIKILDDIWFRAKDITTVLGYSETDKRKPIRRHVDGDDKTTLAILCEKSKGAITATLDRNTKDTLYINESGMYTLIFGSKLSVAKAFTRWVTSEVIPSIRRTGRYENQELINRVNKLELENHTLTTDNQTLNSDIQKKDDMIQEKDTTINIKSEVVAPPTRDPKYDTYFILVEISKDYKYVEGDPKYYKDTNYISTRCQKRSIDTLITRIQKAGYGSNSAARVVCMFLNPNAINYMLRLKNEYSNLIKSKYNGITTSLSESQLIAIIHDVNAEKYPYG
jgi:prophage antirepressor-like protein